jgi:hypothetical protein
MSESPNAEPTPPSRSCGFTASDVLSVFTPDSATAIDGTRHVPGLSSLTSDALPGWRVSGRGELAGVGSVRAGWCGSFYSSGVCRVR